MELVRLTLINSRDEIIIDELVRPDYDIVDYNTSFSGITQEKIDSAKLNFKEAQQLFLNHVYEDTILVGHSLESDLKVLRVSFTFFYLFFFSFIFFSYFFLLLSLYFSSK